MNYPKYITYGTTHFWDNGRQLFQAYYCGKTISQTFASSKKALAKARQVAEMTKAEYMNRGIRAQVVQVQPQWYGGANVL